MAIFLKNKKVGFIFLLVIIFIFSFGLRYFIYSYQGFAKTGYFNLLIARNWAQTGILAYENSDNAILSVDSAGEQGVPVILGNKLTFFIYGLMFKFFGFHRDLPLYTTFLIYSICSVLLYLIVRRHFRLEIALTAGFLGIVAPYTLPISNLIGHQEWAYLFLIIASLIYFWPKERKWVHLILAGLFLGLSAAAKNSFFVAFAAFIAFELWNQRRILKAAILRSLAMLAPFLVVVLPFILIGGNVYFAVLLGFSGSPSEPFYIFGHLFPDPYTFHNEKQEFLRDTYTKNESSSLGTKFAFWGDSGLFLQDYGAPIGFFKSQIVTRLYSSWIYFKGLFLSLIVLGGVLTWLLIFLGGQELWRQKKYNWIVFGSLSICLWFLLLVFMRTSNYVHLIILNLPLSIFLALSISRIARLAAERFNLEQKAGKLVLAVVTAGFVFFFFQISWWNLHEAYVNPGPTRQILSFARDEENKNLFDKNGVTAVGWSSDIPEALVYYLDRNFIYFAPATIEKLAAKNELEQVFKRYGVTGFIGYDKELAEIITRNTGNKLKNISISE